jgi:site-specific DNA-methyltransferase (adenine-specific)
MMEKIELNNGSIVLYSADCFDVFPLLEKNSIDMVLADLPYGTTRNKWDSVLPLDILWREYKRIAKQNTAMVFTASQPFTSKLVMSNLKWFKYEWIWDKHRPSGFQLAKTQPMLLLDQPEEACPQMFLNR